MVQATFMRYCKNYSHCKGKIIMGLDRYCPRCQKKSIAKNYVKRFEQRTKEIYEKMVM